jgi:hypothetical protein
MNFFTGLIKSSGRRHFDGTNGIYLFIYLFFVTRIVEMMTLINSLLILMYQMLAVHVKLTFLQTKLGFHLLFSDFERVIPKRTLKTLLFFMFG